MAAHQACVRSLPSCFICAFFAFIPPYSLRAQGCKLRGENKPERTLIWATRFCIPQRYPWVYGSMAIMVLIGPLRRTAGIAGCCFCCKCSLLAMSLVWYASQRPSATNLLHFRYRLQQAWNAQPQARRSCRGFPSPTMPQGARPFSTKSYIYTTSCEHQNIRQYIPMCCKITL